MVLLVVGTMVSQAADKKFVQQMEKELFGMDKITGMEPWLKKAESFEKIASQNSSEWLAYYYESYAYLKAGMEAKENIQADRYYDQAISVLEKADNLSPANSEVSILKSWILSMKISLDPASRGYELGTQVNQLVSAAIVQDPANPRPYLMQGYSAMYTPEEYGGSKKAAAEYFSLCIQKFAEFKPTSSIMPSWGLDKAKEMLNEVK